MSTFLQLCQETATQCGITGGGPTTVVSQSGELQRVVEWVRDAYIEIQGDTDWRWLRRKFTLVTSSGDDKYAFGDCTDVDAAGAITRFKSWKLNDRRNPPKIYLTSAGVGGETILTWTTWDNFEYLYKTGALQTQTGQPIHVTVDPQDNIRLGLSPNDSYTMTGTFHRSAQILDVTNNNDTPEMPTEYHRLIVYQAMLFYSDYESAPDAERRAIRGVRRITPQLRRDQGTVFRVGAPLA